MADIRTLVFRIQSDFSSANEGVEGFIDNFNKLDTLAQNFGKRMADANKAAGESASRLGGSFKISDTDLMPFTAMEKGSAAAMSNLKALHDAVVKLQDDLQRQGQGGKAFDADIKELQALQSEVEQAAAKLQQMPGIMKAALETPGGANMAGDLFKKMVEDASQAASAIQASFEKLSGKSEIQYAMGLDEFPQMAHNAVDALQQVVDQFDKLKQMQAGLGENLGARILNPQGIKEFGAALNGLESPIQKAMEQLQKFIDLSNKLGAGSSVKEIDAAKKAYADFEATLKQVTEAESKAASSGAAAGSFGTLKGIMGDLTMQTGLLAAGFFGWFTVIQDGEGVIKSVISSGLQLQENMVQLGNATGLTKDQVAGVFDSLRGISQSTGIGLDPLVESFKNVSREGFNVSDSEKIVAETTKDTLAFMADQASMGKNLAIVLHDWDQSAQQVSGVNEMLAQSAIKGNTSIETFTEQFAKASPVAKQFGLSQSELAGDLATFSEKTGNAANAGNQMGLMFTRLVENSSKVQSAIGAIEPAMAAAFSPQALNSAGGMQRALEIIAKIAPEHPDVWKAAFGIFSSTDQAITLTAGDLKDLNKNTQDAALAASGVLTPAMSGAEKQMGTTKQQIQVLNQQWNDLKRDFGSTFAVPGLEIMLKIPEQIGQNFKGLGTVLSDFRNHDLKQLAKDMNDPNLFKIAQPTGLTKDDFPQFPEQFHKVSDTIGPWVDDLKKSASGANDPSQAAVDVTTKIATSISTITKGVEDAMKLLAQAQHFNIPDNIDQLITPIATAMKKVYDAVANAFQSTPSFQAKNNDEIVKFITDSIKAMEDIIKLLGELPTADLSDQGPAIDKLAATLVQIEQKVQKAFDDANEASKAGQTALNGEISKSIAQEATALKDIAGLYKEMEGVDFGTPDSTIKKLADEAKTIADYMGPILAGVGPVSDQLGKAAELIGHEATTLKDIAGLYKETSGVDFGTPDSVFRLLASEAKNISGLMGPVLSSMGPIPDQLNKAAELVGHEATAMKDIAGLYKETAGVDFGTPDSVFVLLAQEAARISQLMGPVLANIGKVPDDLNKAAELVGHEATALKDIAGLFKETEGVDLGQPDSVIVQLADKAGKISEAMGPVLASLGKVPPELDKAAELVGHEASALKDIASMLKEGAQTSFNGADDTLDSLVEFAEKMSEKMNDVLQELGHVDPQMSKAAELISNEGKALKDTAEAVTAMGQIPTLDEGKIGAVLDQLITVMQQALKDFDEKLQRTANDPSLVGKIAQDAASVMKGVGDAAKVVEDLSTLPTIDKGRMEAGINKLVDMMVDALKYFDQQVNDKLKEGIPALASDAAKTAGEVMKAITDVEKVFEVSAPKKTVSVTFGDIKKSIAMAVDTLKDFIKEIDGSGIDMGDVAKAEKFAEVISKMFEAIDHIEKAGKDSGLGASGMGGNPAQQWLEGGGPAQLQSMQRVVNAMNSMGGSTEQKVTAGMQMTANEWIPPKQQQMPNLGNFISGLQGETPDYATLFGQSSGSSKPKTSFPSQLPRLPGYENPARPRIPAPPALGGHKDEGVTVNLDINMDSEKIARALGQKFFGGQTMRGQLNPT